MKGGEKDSRPPLPKKNMKLQMIKMTSLESDKEYSILWKEERRQSLLSSGYNEDDEEFEEVIHPQAKSE